MVISIIKSGKRKMLLIMDQPLFDEQRYLVNVGLEERLRSRRAKVPSVTRLWVSLYCGRGIDHDPLR